MAWYIAHAIMCVRYKDGNQNNFPIWENIILIDATSNDQAYEKAIVRATKDEGDSGGSFTCDKRPACIVLAGIRKVIEVALPEEDLCDGKELSYSQYEVNDEESVQKIARGETVAVLYEGE